MVAGPGDAHQLGVSSNLIAIAIGKPTGQEAVNDQFAESLNDVCLMESHMREGAVCPVSCGSDGFRYSRSLERWRGGGQNYPHVLLSYSIWHGEVHKPIGWKCAIFLYIDLTCEPSAANLAVVVAAGYT